MPKQSAGLRRQLSFHCLCAEVQSQGAIQDCYLTAYHITEDTEGPKLETEEKVFKCFVKPRQQREAEAVWLLLTTLECVNPFYSIYLSVSVCSTHVTEKKKYIYTVHIWNYLRVLKKIKIASKSYIIISKPQTSTFLLPRVRRNIFLRHESHEGCACLISLPLQLYTMHSMRRLSDSEILQVLYTTMVSLKEHATNSMASIQTCFTNALCLFLQPIWEFLALQWWHSFNLQQSNS